MSTVHRLRAVAASVLVALACTAAWQPAHAGLFDDEEARKAILDLRNRIDQNQKAALAREADFNEQMATTRRSMLDLNAQIETLRAEVARLRGADEQSTQSIKELARDLAEVQRKQKDLSSGVEDRLRRFEPQKVSLDGREITVDPQEKRAYDDAIAVLRKGEFPAAIQAFQGFEQRFPSSPYAGHVQYWLGNAYYGNGDVKAAMGSFRSMLSATPDHPRAAEAMLALANCQIELKDPKTARKTLENLVKSFPQSEAAQAARDRLARLK